MPGVTKREIETMLGFIKADLATESSTLIFLVDTSDGLFIPPGWVKKWLPSLDIAWYNYMQGRPCSMHGYYVEDVTGFLESQLRLTKDDTA